MEFQEPWELEESEPETIRIPKGKTRIWIYNRKSNPPDIERLKAAIYKQPNRLHVDELKICYNSQMKSMWVSDCFPNVVSVGVSGRKLKTLHELSGLTKLKRLGIDIDRATRSLDVLPRLNLDALGVLFRKDSDIEHVGQCINVKSIGLNNWPYKDLGLISRLQPRSLGVRGRRLLSSAGLNCPPLRRADFTYCSNLADISSTEAEHLDIAACGRLRLGTIRGGQFLKSLSFTSQKNIETFSFLDNCPALECLSVQASNIVTKDFGGIIRSKSLHGVWLCPRVTDAEVEHIARSNMNLHVSNGRVAYRHGEKIPRSEMSLCKRDGKQIDLLARSLGLDSSRDVAGGTDRANDD